MTFFCTQVIVDEVEVVCYISVNLTLSDGRGVRYASRVGLFYLKTTAQLETTRWRGALLDDHFVHLFRKQCWRVNQSASHEGFLKRVCGFLYLPSWG